MGLSLGERHSDWVWNRNGVCLEYSGRVDGGTLQPEAESESQTKRRRQLFLEVNPPLKTQITAVLADEKSYFVQRDHVTNLDRLALKVRA